MNFAGWYGIIGGLFMMGQWGLFLATGQVPELRTEPLRICFHLAGEFITAIGLCLSGTALLRKLPWAKDAYLVAAGMLLYTVIVSPGYFAHQGQWPMVGMFAMLLVLTVGSIVGVLRGMRSGRRLSNDQ